MWFSFYLNVAIVCFELKGRVGCIHGRIMNNLYGMGRSFYGFGLSGKRQDNGLDRVCNEHQVGLLF